MHFTPKAGLLVRDPATMRPVPAAGQRVKSHTDYWVRRANDGDGTLGEPPAEPKAAPRPARSADK
jgi:hypothetical protein